MSSVLQYYSLSRQEKPPRDKGVFSPPTHFKVSLTGLFYMFEGTSLLLRYFEGKCL